MTEDVKAQKFSTLFRWFDQNGDGRLTHDDLQNMAEMFAGLAREDDKENATAMRNAFETWWQLLLTHGDADGNGQISRQEFITVMEANVTHPQHFEAAVLAIVDALMRALDADKDGVLSLPEYVRMYDALGIPPEHSEPAFRRLDRDGDGSLSHAEFRAAITEFYLSPDPKAPGNWLLGPFA
ncbi:EF-hand domain-containing protein [Streptomyces aureoverticillatus]|uniref:EF-hand domain-containing protein n=1 Tax=Streptomyces aureoverticillatus TaxID=66871 RepID=UPI0013DD7154|nr:EF-hand domain-containing protein [Streptomyces aureoverticillatus]QIB47612.1 calcium-binding protein [Streptomyces aureoverticillatus]